MHLSNLLVFTAAGLAHGHAVFMGIAGKGSPSAQYPAVPGDGALFHERNHAPRQARGHDAPSVELPGEWWDSRENGLQTEDYSDTSQLQCRNHPKGPSTMTLSAGETLDLVWGFQVPHTGPVHLYMSFDDDKTWVLLTQMIDTFIVSNFDGWDSGRDARPDFRPFLVQRIKLPDNLPSSKSATLRTEYMDTAAPQSWIQCLDVETVGPGSPIAADDPGAFKIEGLPNRGGPSHMPNLYTQPTPGDRPYQYKSGANSGFTLEAQGLKFRDYQDNIWPKVLGGKPVYDFGKRDNKPVDYARNIEVVANRTTSTDGEQWPPYDFINVGAMNPDGKSSN